MELNVLNKKKTCGANKDMPIYYKHELLKCTALGELHLTFQNYKKTNLSCMIRMELIGSKMSLNGRLVAKNSNSSRQGE